MSDDFSFRTRNVVLIGVFIAIALPVCLVYLVLRQSTQAEASYRGIEHTYEVLINLDELRSIVRQAESEQRAFLLTHDGAFAARFEMAAARVPVILDRINALVSDNASQRLRATKLKSVLQTRMEMMVRNRSLLIETQAQELVSRLEAGAAKTADLERIVSAMAAEEQNLLETRRGAYLEIRRSLELGAIAATAVGTFLVGGIGIVLVRENRRRVAYEQKIAEARDAALDAVDATSAFVASVSHEIRTPMNGIMGATDLLLRDRSLSAKQRSGLETINISAHSLLALMNDILDLSKVRAGQLSFGKEDFSPAEVVEEVVVLFSPTASKKRIELAHTVDVNVPAAVKGDRLRLRQVLVNLVSNAVKFTEKGGVAIHVVRRTELERVGHLCLRFDVRDTGPGISREAQANLFKPFSQVDAKLAQRHGGTGLGLAISKELVHRMNGALGVESAPGEGAMFWFAVDFETPDFLDVAPMVALEGRRVLIVESRPLTAEAMRGHLEAWGMHPLVVSNSENIPTAAPTGWNGEHGEVAIVLGAVANQDFAADIQRLRNAAWLTSAMIVLMTDEDVPDERVRKLGIGATVSYPFRPSQLYDLLSGSTEGPEPFPESVPLPTATIIVADDNPINQQVLSNQLEHLGMRAVTCSNGLEAVTKVHEEAGQLVLMDCQMPDMDGFEATRVIRRWEEEEKKPRIPIIAVTANVMAGDAEECLRSGMDGYLAKPVDYNSLHQVLAKWLPKSQVISMRPAVLPESAQSGSSNNPSSASNGEQQSESKIEDNTIPIIDEEQLRLCLSGDTEMDQSLLQSALKLADDEIDKMASVLTTETGETWERSAHRGRGSCAMMGFSHIAAEFGEAEFHAPTKELRTECIQKLRAASQRLKLRAQEIHLG